MVVVRAIRPPTDWPVAQREFRERYTADPSAAHRQDARVRWWANPPPTAGGTIGIAAGLSAVLGRWSAGRGMSEGTFVAVYAPTTGPGARPVMVFPVSDDPALPPGSGSGDATIAGEVGLNACCCVEIPDGPVLWPSYNPIVPTGRFVPAP